MFNSAQGALDVDVLLERLPYIECGHVDVVQGVTPITALGIGWQAALPCNLDSILEIETGGPTGGCVQPLRPGPTYHPKAGVPCEYRDAPRPAASRLCEESGKALASSSGGRATAVDARLKKVKTDRSFAQRHLPRRD
jgi:hypothetical protein